MAAARPPGQGPYRIIFHDGADYVGNAADLVEVRIAPRTDDVMYLVTLNTLLREHDDRRAGLRHPVTYSR